MQGDLTAMDHRTLSGQRGYLPIRAASPRLDATSKYTGPGRVIPYLADVLNRVSELADRLGAEIYDVAMRYADIAADRFWVAFTRPGVAQEIRHLRVAVVPK